MDKLVQFEEQFGVTRDKWTKGNWREAALYLAGLSSLPPKVGRPKLDEYKADNIPALFFWAEQARAVNKSLSLKKAVEQVIGESLTNSEPHRLVDEYRIASIYKQVLKHRETLKKTTRKKN